MADHFPLPPRQDGPLAITHVTVLPMDEERLLPDQTVVLKNGHIEALGPASILATDGMQHVDGTGKYLLPGLADMHGPNQSLSWSQQRRAMVRWYGRASCLITSRAMKLDDSRIAIASRASKRS